MQSAPTAEPGGRMPASARAGKLHFDPLEPRLLMSADVLAIDLGHLQPAQHQHDLLVQMVTDTVQVGNQAQSVQRVQIVDQDANNAVLFLSSTTCYSLIPCSSNLRGMQHLSCNGTLSSMCLILFEPIHL